MLLLALMGADAEACSPVPNDQVEVVPLDGQLDVALDQIIVLRVGADVLTQDPDVVLRGPDGVLGTQVTATWFEESQSFRSYVILEVIPDATLAPDALFSVSLADGTEIVGTTHFETAAETRGPQQPSAALGYGGSGYRVEDECFSQTQVGTVTLSAVGAEQVAWLALRELELLHLDGPREETGRQWAWIPALDGLQRDVHVPVDDRDAVGTLCFDATLVDAVGVAHELTPSCASAGGVDPSGIGMSSRCSMVPVAAGPWAMLLGLVALRRRRRPDRD
jgi:hypothetical protein